jgi:hypothetical protein
MSLESDLAFYNQIKPDLLEKDIEGSFVLIQDGALVDVYPTYKEAYDAAVAKFGTAQVFIKKVEAQDTVETI